MPTRTIILTALIASCVSSAVTLTTTLLKGAVNVYVPRRERLGKLRALRSNGGLNAYVDRNQRCL